MYSMSRLPPPLILSLFKHSWVSACKTLKGSHHLTSSSLPSTTRFSFSSPSSIESSELFVQKVLMNVTLAILLIRAFHLCLNSQANFFSGWQRWGNCFRSLSSCYLTHSQPTPTFSSHLLMSALFILSFAPQCDKNKIVDLKWLR